MCSRSIIRIQNNADHLHGSPLLPASVRARLEDEVTAAWREFSGQAGVTVFPASETLHDEFWRFLKCR